MDSQEPQDNRDGKNLFDGDYSSVSFVFVDLYFTGLAIVRDFAVADAKYLFAEFDNNYANPPVYINPGV